jgi:hypothetical protein
MKLGEIARLDGVFLPRCWRKQKWRSEGAAQAHLRALKRSSGVKDEDRLNTYPCPYCKWWHVGRR